MSLTYTDLPNTQFPEAIDDWYRYEDPNLQELEVINKYYEYMNSNDLNSAVAILESNPNLKTKIVNADNLNKLRDGLISLERFFFSDVEKYLMDLMQDMGEWSNSQKYGKYNVVQYKDEVYMCIDAQTPIGTLPTDINYFIKLAIKGEQGASGIGLSYRYGGWDSTVQYYKEDCVEYNNVLWAAKKDNIGQTPADGSEYWDKVISFNLMLEEINTALEGKADKTHTHKAKEISIENVDNYFENNNVEGALNEIAKRIGKISFSITDKGILRVIYEEE